MSVRAFFRRLRAIAWRAEAVSESAEDAQLAAIQREVERGLDALRHAQEESAASCESAGAAPGMSRREGHARSIAGG